MTLNLAHLNEFNTSLEQRSDTPTQIKLVGLRELSNNDPREKRASFVFNYIQGDNPAHHHDNMASRKTAKSREPDVLSAAYLEGTSNKVRFMMYILSSLLSNDCVHMHLSIHEGDR